VTPQGPNNTSAANPYVNYTFPQFYTTQTSTNEFFYEGFESSSGAATATPCAGLRYNSGPYTVPFVMPNSRQYQIDYHYLSGGVWYPMTKAYTNNIVLSDGSGIDEVRVYPTDAQMTTYTYNPLVGITSQCDPRNRITYYDYDSYSRLKDIKDNDGNIIKAYDFQYQVTPQ
jgi:YD repeat-containing protein